MLHQMNSVFLRLWVAFDQMMSNLSKSFPGRNGLQEPRGCTTVFNCADLWSAKRWDQQTYWITRKAQSGVKSPKRKM